MTHLECIFVRSPLMSVYPGKARHVRFKTEYLGMDLAHFFFLRINDSVNLFVMEVIKLEILM
jgi:hypothetical protein